MKNGLTWFNEQWKEIFIAVLSNERELSMKKGFHLLEASLNYALCFLLI